MADHAVGLEEAQGAEESLLLDSAEDTRDRSLRQRTAASLLAMSGLAALVLAAASLQKPKHYITSEAITLASIKEEMAPWECQHYVDDQDDDWCQNIGTLDGIEYKWVGYGANVCGDCWCCKQQVEVKTGANTSAKGVKGGRTKTTELTTTTEQTTSTTKYTGWGCQHYEDWQNDDWCKTVGSKDGIKYVWAGPDSDLCGDCWCCKQDDEAFENCSANETENCRESKCCKQDGFQCYEQNDTWATCKSTCTEKGWSCKELGDRTPMYIDPEGVAPGEICALGGKCKDPGYQCYQKDDYFSQCQVLCNETNWTCTELGNRTPVERRGGTECAWGAELCSPTGCCVGEGLKCFARDQYWSTCLASCKHDMDVGMGPEKWACEEFGDRRKVELGCTWMAEECTVTRKCCQEGYVCAYKTNEKAFCTVDPGQWGWNGTIIGGAQSEWPVQPVGPGQQEAGTSLYCFMAVLPGSAEDGLVWNARDKGVSIFACDGSKVYHSWWSQWAQNWDSVVNTDVFVNVWEQVLADKTFKSFDWTAKVDPDAVFFPDRLRFKLQQAHPPAEFPIYIKNTVIGFGFFGACEVFSQEAINKYGKYWHECLAAISTSSGEDGYMKGCMDMIGAGYIFIEDVLRTPFHDSACNDPGRVTFHPRKFVDGWNQCLGEASMQFQRK